VKNPDPIKRAWRLERRRAELGSDNPQCVYCGESNIACLEVEHPVTRKYDPLFKRAVCRNCHRKLELNRDVAGLTKNGLHATKEESELEALHSYLSLLAADQDSLADLLLSPTASRQLIASALQAAAASIRRKTKPQSQLTPPRRRPPYKRIEPSNLVPDQGHPHQQAPGGSLQ